MPLIGIKSIPCPFPTPLGHRKVQITFEWNTCTTKAGKWRHDLRGAQWCTKARFWEQGHNRLWNPSRVKFLLRDDTATFEHKRLYYSVKSTLHLLHLLYPHPKMGGYCNRLCVRACVCPPVQAIDFFFFTIWTFVIKSSTNLHYENVEKIIKKGIKMWEDKVIATINSWPYEPLRSVSSTRRSFFCFFLNRCLFIYHRASVCPY